MANNRFIEANQEAYEVTKSVREQFFPLLEKAVIKILFDTKMRKRGGKIVLARILKANDLIRRLTDDLAEEGCDYVLFYDEVAFKNIPPENKVRLARHEMRHCKVVGTPEKPKYKIIPHDLEDFLIEVELNKDNVGWARDAVDLVTMIYDQMEESRKEQEKAAEQKEEVTATAPATEPAQQRRFLRK